MDNVRTLARLLSRVENGDRDGIKDLKPGKARVIGITGAPGVGKSTVTGALTAEFRKSAQRVGVLAIDPSSPFTGGALLGDRVRMQEHSLDDGVFIRSMASRGHLGGLAGATPQAVRVLDAFGFDVILIETVGVGQAEVEIAAQADSVIVLTAPGLGDAIQAAKAGILETGDIFVVNKADKPEAQHTVRDLRTMLALGNWENRWKPPVISTVGTDFTGIAEVAGKLAEHWTWLNESGELASRRLNRARSEILALASGMLENKIPAARLNELARYVADGTLDPFEAASELSSAGSWPARPAAGAANA